MKLESKKLDNQIIGNIGLYYACYELSKRGWNVMPTSRNAKGIDILMYNQDATRTLSIQVKALSKKNPAPFGSKLNLIADYYIICRKVLEDKPEVYIATKRQINENMRSNLKDGKTSYWLQTKDYEGFADRWDIIGKGND